MSILDDVFGFFVEESVEHLTVLEEGLLGLEKDPASGEGVIEPLFRAAHTLKGSANLVNVTEVGAIAHRLEDILEEIRDGHSLPTKSRVSAMLFALDQIRELVHLRKQGAAAPENMVTEALSRLAQADNPDLVEEQDVAETGAMAAEVIPASVEVNHDYAGQERREPARRFEEAGVVRVGMDKIEALMGLVGEFTIAKNHLMNRLPELEEMRTEVDFAGKRLLKEVAGFSERYDYTLPMQNSLSQDDSFQELEFDRYDELNLFSRKLSEITNDIEEAIKEVCS